jgi:hypothetical protein
MRVWLLGCIVGAVSAAAIACHDVPTVCSAELRYGMAVHVRDSASGAGLANGATVVVRDLNFVDSLAATFPASADGPFLSAGERAGTYTVTVRHSGYQTWTRSGIIVTAAECHVNPINVIARLQP